MTIRQITRTWLGLGAALMLTQCDRDRTPQAPAAAEAPPTALEAPTTLGRADIVFALAQAASIHAAGGPAADGPTIVGRAFEVRLPFGCSGAAATAGGTPGLAGWSWSPDRRTITIAFTPADWSQSPLVRDPGQTPDWDAVEGFWIARPWLAADACPRSAPAAVAVVPRVAPPAESDGGEGPEPMIETLRPLPPAPSPMTAGLAAIQSAEGSRLGRRDGEAYRFVLRGTGEAPPVAPPDGFRLVLAGRIGAFPDARAIRCTAQSPDVRPVCIAAVELDVVAFEDAAGRRLSEWRPT